MSVLLIDPERSSIRKGNIWKVINRSLPTLGLAYIAAFLEKQGIKVKIIDMRAQIWDMPDIISVVKEFKPEFIGITVTTVQISSALRIAKYIRDFNKDIKIVMGGPHPHIFARDLLKYEFIDYIVRGEGEYTLWELVSGKELTSIKGLTYKLNGDIISNPDRPLTVDLDTFPFPARHLLPMDKYRPSTGRYRRLPATSMLISRGCPGKCTFCYTDVLGRAIRFRSIDNIMEEIKLLVDCYGIREVSFYDDTFTARRDIIFGVCDRIFNEGIDLSWSCSSRVDCVDERLLQLMKRAGCHLVSYGVESADEGILKNINKKISLEKVKEVVALTKKAGILTQTSFMIGNPGETEETVKKTIGFILKLNPDLLVYNITTPFPGTAMFEWAKENGYLTTHNWDDYDLGHIVMRLPTITPESIQYYYKYVYRKFYCRPAYIIKHIKNIKSLDIFKANLKVFFAMLHNVIFK